MDIKKGLQAVWSALFPTPEERAARDRKDRIASIESNLTYAVHGKAVDYEAQNKYNTSAMVGASAMAGGCAFAMAPVFMKISIAEQKEAIANFSDQLKDLGVSQERIDAVIKTATDYKHKYDPNGYDYM